MTAEELDSGIVLLAGAVHKQGEAKVDGFVTQVLDSIEKSPDLAAEARCAGLLGAMFHDLKPVGYTPHEPRYDALLHRVMAIFDRERSQTVDIRVRIAAAEALGQVGDPRLEFDHPQRWITIPAGKFWMGSQKTDKTKPNFDEETTEWCGPVREVTLPEFKLARFPVTVGEFARFVERKGLHQGKVLDASGWLRPIHRAGGLDAATRTWQSAGGRRQLVRSDGLLPMGRSSVADRGGVGTRRARHKRKTVSVGTGRSKRDAIELRWQHQRAHASRDLSTRRDAGRDRRHGGERVGVVR